MKKISEFNVLWDRLYSESIGQQFLRFRRQDVRVLWFCRSPHNCNVLILFDSSHFMNTDDLASMKSKMLSEIVLGAVPIAYKQKTAKTSLIAVDSRCFAMVFSELSDETDLISAPRPNRDMLYRSNKFGIAFVYLANTLLEFRYLSFHSEMISFFVQLLQQEFYAVMTQNSSFANESHLHIVEKAFYEKAVVETDTFFSAVQNHLKSSYCKISSKRWSDICPANFVDLVMECAMILEKKEMNYLASGLFSVFLSIIETVSISKFACLYAKYHKNQQIIFVGVSKQIPLIKSLIGLMNYFIVGITPLLLNFALIQSVSTSTKADFMPFVDIQIICCPENTVKTWQLLFKRHNLKKKNIYMVNLNDCQLSRLVGYNNFSTFTPSASVVTIFECVIEAYKIGVSKQFCDEYLRKEIVLLAYRTSFIKKNQNSTALRTALGLAEY